MHRLSVYTDASFAPTGAESHEGLVILHGSSQDDPTTGNVVMWKSVRQRLVTKSTCESELLACSNGLEQAGNLGMQLAEATRTPISYTLHCDNSAAVKQIRDGPNGSFRTRHISVKGLWVHQMVELGVDLQFTPTTKQVADALTKGLGAQKLPHVMSQLHLEQ